MKALTILGSPNSQGNNSLLLDRLITKIKERNSTIEFENLAINNLNISPCSACNYCLTKKGCKINDDMTDLYQKFNHADLIIIAAPLYFNSLPAQLKALIDRCQAIWGSKYSLNDSLIDRSKNRKGYFISTAGQALTKERFQYVVGTMDLFFKSINTDYVDNFFVGGLDQLSVKEQYGILQDIDDFAEKIAKN